MGASQSSQKRTVTLQNPYPEGVISVSEDVVNRLRGTARERAAERQEQQKQTQAAGSASAPLPPPAATAEKPSTAASSIPSSHGNAPIYPPPNVIFVEPTITAMDVRRQKEAELAQNDLYWKKRMNQLEQTLNKTNAIMEKEYSAAVEDVRKSFQNAPATHQLPPCQDLKAQLIACYRAHPGETLRCSEEVAAFTNCVSENRIKKLDQSIADEGKTKLTDVKK